MRPLILITTLALALVALTGCGRKQVERVDPSTTIDLNENWNDVDSRQVAEAMIADALSRPWVSDYRTANDNAKPLVRLSPDEVRVRTNGDVVNKDIFLNDIRRAFINSGQVRVLSTRSEASATRDELAEQQDWATEDTKHAQRQEFGADFILHGAINVQDQVEGRYMVKFYSVDLWLTDVQTREQIWAGNHKIKKDVRRPSTR
jgi:PBP1b-binding outer membrane lipoprotein LpoB